MQLVCLAHAGGTSVLYRDWQRALGDATQILALELPGHGARRAQPVCTNWPELIDALCSDLLGRLDPARPFALFGHSMGALVAFRLIHALRARGAEEPVWFGASGSVAPQCRVRETHWLHCSHSGMVDKLRLLGGTPEALLADHGLIDYLLPVLRADFHLCGTYPDHGGDDEAPLNCPVTVFTGRDDPATARESDVIRWRDVTRGACDFRRFEGGHFYLSAAPAALLAQVAVALERGRVSCGRAGAPDSGGTAWVG
ncbi:alpha/beta fold hydrolase [Robbsia sp. Bb-Pol-6]|uniref:Alpha/beta fold hydrolase n=1 Tax=Robbsia betulipollinis TaxID=2981849 RepID=A0ABT3ZJY3_9BURK|nr:alpha/beta fold hydrolase [Robbsia betulipollinis]